MTPHRIVELTILENDTPQSVEKEASRIAYDADVIVEYPELTSVVACSDTPPDPYAKRAVILRVLPDETFLAAFHEADRIARCARVKVKFGLTNKKSEKITSFDIEIAPPTEGMREVKLTTLPQDTREDVEEIARRIHLAAGVAVSDDFYEVDRSSASLGKLDPRMVRRVELFALPGESEERITYEANRIAKTAHVIVVFCHEGIYHQIEPK